MKEFLAKIFVMKFLNGSFLQQSILPHCIDGTKSTDSERLTQIKFFKRVARHSELLDRDDVEGTHSDYFKEH